VQHPLKRICRLHKHPQRNNQALPLKNLKDKDRELFLLSLYNLQNKEERSHFVNELYRRYEGNKRNYVKESYLANYIIDSGDFHI
jgi:hypothetical protein